jgi:HEPN domain-containing protein
MRHDPALVSESRAWFRKAAADLRAADVERAADPPLFADIVFHAQQAAEKTLKGFLTWHHQTFRKTHSLEELGEQCLTISKPGAQTAHRPRRATHRVRVEVSLSGGVDEPDANEADDAVTVAREVFEGVLRALPGDVRP